MALGKPFINSFTPFDATVDHTVVFTYNGENFTKRQYRISYQNGSWINSTEANSTWTVNTKEYSITIPSNRCKNNNGYIIQIRVGNQNNDWSEWSNGTYFWCYAASSLSISGELSGELTQPKLQLANNSYEFIGVYTKPINADDWYSCQYVLKQSDTITGGASVVGNSGLMYRGSDGVFPSYTYDNLSQADGIVYTINLSCNTLHGVILNFTKTFTVSYAQPTVSVSADVSNLKDEDNNYTGKIQIVATASRIRADNTDDVSSFTFIQDPNDVTNYYLDLSNDSREVSYTQGCELLDDNWNIYIFVKNFHAVEYEHRYSPINNLSLGSKIKKNPFIRITSKSLSQDNGNLICYYDADTKHFYVEYEVLGVTARYVTLESLDLKSKLLNGKKVFTNMVAILIRKINNDFVISACLA